MFEVCKVFVYFVYNPSTGEVKIGQTKNVKARLQSLQTEEGVPLILLGVEEDVVPLEKRLHRKFKKFNTRGEWFKVEGALAKYLSQLSALNNTPSLEEEIVSGICRECGGMVTGRRKYCNQVCKQRAYRKRLRGL